MNEPSPDRLAAWRAYLESHAAVIDVLTTELHEAQGLPLSWFDVLVQLSEAPDQRLRMQDLARAVLLSKSGLTRLVQRMQDGGLVDRVPCEDDRRGAFAVLTSAGRERLDAAVPVHLDGVRRHFTDHLDPGQVELIRTALERVASAARTTADAGNA